MKIGITGGTGFVGSHLIRHLAAEGHTITTYGRLENSPNALKKYANYIAWDLDNDSLPKQFNGDIFIHTAGFVEFWGSYEEMYKTNVEGTLKALEVAKNAKQFIYISTASVYDSFKNKNRISEGVHYPKQYANNYARTKAEAEKIIIKNSNKFEKVTIIRPHAIYGPGDRTLIPRILQSIRSNKAFIIGSGKNRFSITHVGNICYGISLIINSKQKGLKIYNLTDKESSSINDIYKHLCNTLNLKVQIIHVPYSLAKPFAGILENIYTFTKSKEPPLLTPDIARQFTQESTLSLDKIVSELKYEPLYQMRDGFKDLNVWIGSIGGIKNYTSQPVDCWSGKLFTY